MNNKNKKPSTSKKIFFITILLHIFVFFVLFLGMFIYGIFFPRETRSRYDSDLKKWPEFTIEKFLSGEYTKGISEYYVDTIHGRDNFKDMASQIKTLYGITEEEQEFGEFIPPDDIIDEPVIPDVDVSENEKSDDISETVSEQEQSGETSREDSVSEPSDDKPQQPHAEELCKGIVILDTRAMEIYYGNKPNAKTYAEYLNAYAKDLESSANVYSMVIPKSCAYYIHDSKKYSNAWKYTVENFDVIKDSLSGVKNVDVYNALLPHKDEDIYFRTDHHWTGLGAYYAAEELAKVAGVDFADLSTYEKKVRSGFVGSMYVYTNYSATLLNNPEDFVTYVPSDSYTATFYNQNFKNGREHDIYYYVNDKNIRNWYMTFINGDNNCVKIKSDVCKNGRKLFIIKDSYGDALAPYFLQSFEEIYIADLRKFELNAIDFIKENDITDVVFALSAYSATGSSVNKNIERLRTK